MRHTLVTQGRLGIRHQRLDAARTVATGRNVTTIEGLACRLAGGFVRSIDADVLRATVDEVHHGIALPRGPATAVVTFTPDKSAT